MKKSNVIVGCLCAGWFVFAIASARVPGINYFKAKRINLMIHRYLPTGSNKARTKSFLDKEGFEYSFNTVPNGSVQAQTVIRGTSWGALISVDTQYTFLFDRDDKLQKISIEEFGTGP